MSTEYFIKENNIVSVDSVFEKMQKIKLSISEEVQKRIDNPIEAYIEQSLSLKIKDEIKRKKREELLRKKYDLEIGLNSNNNIDKIKEILNTYDLVQNFSFLDKDTKKRRCILRYDSFWLNEEYNKYKTKFIEYLDSKPEFYKHFKHLLNLYIRKYSTLKNDKDFMDLLRNMSKKYNDNKKSIPIFIKNISADCNILKKNIEKELSKHCIQEKSNSNNKIVDIIKNRYRYIRPNTDLFNEMIITICDICKTKIQEEFYFNLLFNEILIADIDKESSGKIVSDIIKLFAYDKNNISSEDLNEIKWALLKNPNYGDPRITRSEKNWFFVEKAKEKDYNGRQVFITWLAQSDLDFFFEFAFKGIDDSQGRKAFWQGYIKSHQLVESHVIWGQVHYNMPEIQEEQERSNVEFKYFVHEDNCSCFILKFNDIYVVEYSMKNNAVFIYSIDKFIDITSNYFWDRSVFKQTETTLFAQKDIDKYSLDIKKYGILKIPHYPKWENVVEKILQFNGIYKE